VATGAGLLVALYWLTYGYLSLWEGRALHWSRLWPDMLPGIGLLFLVFMSRRHPGPYGTALLLTGLLLLGVAVVQHWALMQALAISLPIMAVGALLLMWKSSLALNSK